MLKKLVRGVALATMLTAVAGLWLFAVGEAAAPAAGKVPLIVVDNIVVGRVNVPQERVCVQASRFLRGEQVVWQIKVVDPSTGKEMKSSQIKKIWVELVDGQVLEAKYGDRPKDNPTDGFWAAAWEIPKNYPTGVVDYTIYAEAVDGRTGKNVKFMLEVAMLTIIADASKR